LRSFANPQTSVNARGALLKDGFSFFEKPGDYSGDLIAFRVESEAPTVLSLAQDKALTGEVLWLAGRAVDDKATEAGSLLYPGRVVISDEKHLVLRMGKAIPNRAFSGSPILNARGEVAGMMLGSSTSEGTTYFLINPALAIRARLSKVPGTGVAQP